jgi:hypothetical protein
MSLEMILVVHNDIVHYVVFRIFLGALGFFEI